MGHGVSKEALQSQYLSGESRLETARETWVGEDAFVELDVSLR